MTSSRSANRHPRSSRLTLLGAAIAALALAGCNTTELVDKPTTWVSGLIKTGKWTQMERSSLNEVEIVTIETILRHKRQQDISTGVQQYYDKPGNNVVVTVTPTETGGVLELNES